MDSIEEARKIVDNNAMLRFAAIAMTDWLLLPSFPMVANVSPSVHSLSSPCSNCKGTFKSATRSVQVPELQLLDASDPSTSAKFEPLSEEYVVGGRYRLGGFGNGRPVPLFQTVPKQRVSSTSRRLRRAVHRVALRQQRIMRVGVHVVHLPSGEETSVGSRKIFPLASVAKLPIMVEAALQLQESEKMNGSLKLNTPVSVRERDKCIGSGHLWKKRSGSKVSFGKSLELMQTVSDNTAADLVLQRVTLARVRQLMVNLGLNATNIYLSQRQAYLIAMGKAPEMFGMSPRQLANTWNKLTINQRMKVASQTEAANKDLSFLDFNSMEASAEKLLELEKSCQNWRDNLAVAAAVDNTGSPADIAHLLAMLARGEILSQAWTGHCLSILAKQKYGVRRLPCYLPKDTAIYHKTGSIAGVAHDAGIIQVGGVREHVVVTAFVDGIHRHHEREAEAVIARIGRMVYNAYSSRLKWVGKCSNPQLKPCGPLLL